MKRLIAIVILLLIIVNASSCGILVQIPQGTNTNPGTQGTDIGTETATGTLPGTNDGTVISPGTNDKTTDTTETKENIPYDIVEGLYTNYAKNSLLYDVNKGCIVYAHNETEKLYPASTTKLLTAAVALKYIHPDTVFTVGTEQEFVKPHSSLALIKPGHKLKLVDLITGMLLPSGNDAAYTVAVNVARIVSGDPTMNDVKAIAYFCGLMNSYAKGLGAMSSNFTSPEGWHDDNHYSTAYDLLLITLDAMSNEIISEIVSYEKKYVVFASGENITWKNSNLLMDPNSEYFYGQYVCGIKTGSTDEAGKCLISMADNGTNKVIAIVMGCKNDKERYTDSLLLLKAFCGK